MKAGPHVPPKKQMLMISTDQSRQPQHAPAATMPRRSRSALNRMVITALLFAVLISGLLAQNGRQNGYVVWRAVPSANGYRIQIRNSEQRVILSERIDTHYYKVDLDEGSYQVRVAPLDAAGSVMVWSYWRPLRVIQVYDPAVEDSSVTVLPPGDRNAVLRVRGQNFVQATQASIENERGRLPVRSVESNDAGTELTIQTDLSNAEPGAYDLVITNPYNRRTVKENYLTIDASADPGNTGDGRETANTDNGQSNVDLPPGSHYNFTLAQYRAYIRTLNRACNTGGLPDELVSECYPFYVKLDLRDRDRRNLYYFLKGDSENQGDRLRAYDYFSEHCRPVFRPMMELMQERLAPRSGIGPIEKDKIKQAVERIQSCSS